MKEQEQSSSRGDTRRGVLKLAGYGLARNMGLLSSIEAAIYLSEKTEIDTTDFRSLTPAEYHGLIDEYSEALLPYSERKTSHPSLLSTGTFTTEKDQPTFHSLIGSFSPQPKLQVLRAVVDEGKDDQRIYVAPFVRSPELASVTTVIGGLDEGEHTVTWYQDPAQPLVRDELNIVIRTPDEGSVLHDFYIHSPALAVRQDNLANLANDTHLMTCGEMLKKKDAAGEYLFTYSGIFSSEDGGLSVSRRKLQFGRTADIEWMTKVLMKDGRVKKRIYQSQRHTTSTFRGDTFGEQEVLQIATRNNNFSDRLETEQFFSPMAFRLPPEVSVDAVFRLIPSLQKIGDQELQP